MAAIKSLTSPYWPEPVLVFSEDESPYGFVTIEAIGENTGQHCSTTQRTEEWTQGGKRREWVPTFRADPVAFRLAMEAERLRLAYSCDPLLAANNCVVDLVPHQMEAVYEVMLPQPTIRHLLAHDAGAGKTIMCGLLHKELRMRQPGLRTLVVAPAALTVQWQRELEDKFGERFEIIGREEIKSNTRIWAQTRQAITSMSFARQPDIQGTLAQVNWDVVIVDEAHHMAGYEKRETLAYQLGQILGQQARHLVLATATPHKGDAANFLKLLQLLDPGIHDPTVVQQEGGGQRGNALMSRRLKEEMVDFAGERLFKARIVETRWHSIADNPPEMALYTALTEYVQKTYRAAERPGGRERANVQFAMVLLQRRMASSPEALEQSLIRRREVLLRPSREAVPPPGMEVPEDAPEAERWGWEASQETASAARSQRERERESAQLDDLLRQVAEVYKAGIQTKITKLQEILREAGVAPGNGEKLLVFTEFKDTLDHLRRAFESWGYRVTQIDGTMPPELRRKAEADFREHCQVMVATEAAGEGINLQFCARMVNYDLPWVPTRLEQRMGRIHRYGQKRVAYVYNLASADTREGKVLLGLLERLEEMRAHLGDQVFDVVSTLVADVDMEQLLAQVALAPSAEASQEEALNQIIAATRRSEGRLKQWQEHPHPLEPGRYQRLRQASRQSRLTPEYAQHFMVGALRQMKELPAAEGDAGQDPGDAEIFRFQVLRRSVAEHLGLQVGQRVALTFRPEAAEKVRNVQLVALGRRMFDGMLTLAEAEWGPLLWQGAVFLDLDLPPGDGYLLWFVRGAVYDGLGQVVSRVIHTVRQTADSLSEAPASRLIDLAPNTEADVVAQWLQGLARDPQPALHWSMDRQQLHFLEETRALRGQVVAQRRGMVLAEAERSLEHARQAYDEAVFGGEADEAEAERRQREAEERVRMLRWRYEHEAACSLGRAQVLGVAAVLAAVAAPEGERPDERRRIEDAAQEVASGHERSCGRTVTDVSGEHRHYPYDLHSTGAGGVRCIEVKGTTSGHIFLTENERRAAARLGPSYCLYIVSDPLGRPRLTIIHDPLSKMTHDRVLYGGVRYGYEERTWRAAGDEEIVVQE